MRRFLRSFLRSMAALAPIFAATATMAVVGAWDTPIAWAQHGPYQQGKRVFIERCVSCHSVGWNAPAVKPKRLRGTDLTRLFDRRAEEWVKAWVANAFRQDPSTHCRAKVRTALEIRHLVFFLKQRQKDVPKKPVLTAGQGVGTPAHSSITVAVDSTGAAGGAIPMMGNGANPATPVVQPQVGAPVRRVAP